MEHLPQWLKFIKVESHKETNTLQNIRFPIIRLDYQATTNFTKRQRLRNSWWRINFAFVLSWLHFHLGWDNPQTALTQLGGASQVFLLTLSGEDVGSLQPKLSLRARESEVTLLGNTLLFWFFGGIFWLVDV